MSNSSFRLKQPVRHGQDPLLYVGRLTSRPRQSSIGSLFSNLRDFIFEHPVKAEAGIPMAFDTPTFGTGMGENLKEFFHSQPRRNVRSGLLVDWHEDQGLWENLRDWIAPRKLPPLKTTSRPVPIKDIWSKDENFGRTQLVSILVHGAVIAAIVMAPLLLTGTITTQVTNASSPGLVTNVTVTPYKNPLKPGPKTSGGGGGAADNALSTHGRPPKFSPIQIARPIVNPPKADITFNPAVLGPDIKLPDNNTLNWGDPLSNRNTGALGLGHGGGIGGGNGDGMGPGQISGFGDGMPHAGTNGYGTPQCLYCPRADYTDEAMKVKVQGVVELVAVISPDGRVTEVHVAKGLGLGLDEKAIETVRKWRLKPAIGPDNKPAAVRQIIEVTFQLY
jgi:protein TonB